MQHASHLLGFCKSNHCNKTFEKHSILFKVKPPASRAYGPDGKMIILTTDIHIVFRGLKFESDADIGQKRVFCKGL